MKKTALALLALSAALPAAAELSLEVSPARVAAGSPAQVTLRWSGTGAGLLSAPEIPGLERLRGGSFLESPSSVISGGKELRSQAFSWTVTADAAGTYPLGPVTADGETASGTELSVTPAEAPALPAPSSGRGDESVPAAALEISRAEPTPEGNPVARALKRHPLAAVSGFAAAVVLWLAARTWGYLKRGEAAASAGHAPAPEPRAAEPAHAPEGHGHFADQAVAMVRARISRMAGRDVSGLSAAELASLEDDPAKRAALARVLSAADGLRFGRKGDEGEVRRLLADYLA